jgi:uncharacterized membrane protein
VLLYINLADHAVELLADRGIDARVDPRLWHGICTSGMVSGGSHRSTNPLVRWGLWLTPGVRSPCP